MHPLLIVAIIAHHAAPQPSVGRQAEIAAWEARWHRRAELDVARERAEDTARRALITSGVTGLGALSFGTAAVAWGGQPLRLCPEANPCGRAPGVHTGLAVAGAGLGVVALTAAIVGVAYRRKARTLRDRRRLTLMGSGVRITF